MANSSTALAHPVNISIKQKATLNFFLYGTFLPIIVPLMILITYRFIYDTSLLDENVPYFFIPLIGLAFMPFVAAVLYGGEYPWWRGKKGDFVPVDILLYVVGIATVVIVGSLINVTGGYHNSILVFYFYFIPSAIAISFEAKISLYLLIPTCAAYVIYNYFNPIPTPPQFDAEYYKILYGLVICIHFLSIGILELKNNRLKNEL